MAGQVLTITPHFQTMFGVTWDQLQAQQKDHRLAGCYAEKRVMGKDFRGDLFGSTSDVMREKTARAAPTMPVDISTSFWWVKPRPFDYANVYDEFDDVGLGGLPSFQTPAIVTHATVANRNKDLVLFQGMLGTNYTGTTGTTASTLPTAQVIGATYGNSGVNIGLTLKKLNHAGYLFNSNNIEMGERYLAYTSKELENLLSNVDQVANYLYNEVRALMDGIVTSFAGFQFKMTELVPFIAGSTTVRACVAWKKPLVVMGIGADKRTYVDILPTNSHAIQVRSVMLLDVTRKENAGVVEIDCDESV